MLDHTEIAALFTRSDGEFLFARWQRPIAPVIFGVDDATLPVLKGGIEAVVTLAGHKMTEADPELGTNLMMFFVAEWDELREVPDLDRLVPGIGDILDQLEAAGANQYRVFRFEESGAIRAAFAFIRLDEHMRDVPAQTLALSQAVQLALLWSDEAFQNSPPLLIGPDGDVLLKPEIGALIRAAYDPAIPVMGRDPALAYRLAARVDRPT
ncbi:hypothetical protein JQU17_11560 [Ponticoccus sp. SC2-23]|uniref:hypothetical protein n=1 Tax=Alexandriicola marinus TaxID=2081710 RepID=UPI000FDB607F|nr:hypothetical protein [Alexandriicola marinus]MBM1221531.1 hypothetical protein [Ponticoccus sp. SC6-9]MBM1226572.1 hypothetical protein [Ponticoccus sp. SC6-15]MBM1230523.1 hypothetical protein [Ponticoccus sp. SC6-38]MBM1235046.1 hypothetical protein [Ponticoccus sp. SC6-45]MBM1239544.1 hypothetical protein [Ponticoccus sp. SC6-49]MBM1243326.1 hypothetical protein [Ponticoccus sp. SC2-64]MBM1248570.1 hypothetical protein [Ponticoccus sp. SC6-42]MBM1253155.1 hypothetical protein [Pontico